MRESEELGSLAHKLSLGYLHSNFLFPLYPPKPLPLRDPDNCDFPFVPLVVVGFHTMEVDINRDHVFIGFWLRCLALGWCLWRHPRPIEGIGKYESTIACIL